MDCDRIRHISDVISFIEAHLQEKLELDAVADAARYSKYHLHRMFTDTVGITPHDYIQRRRLSEAARRLVFSDTPVLEIALSSGYESQQAFSAVFKSMYKRTPLEYRRNQAFYPLQLALVLNGSPSAPGEVCYASPGDVSDWMSFTALVIDGFPCLEESAHLERVRGHIQRRQALLMRDGTAIIGAAAFSRRTGHIDFLAVHPQYRRCGVWEALLAQMRRGTPAERGLSVTTFRAGDRADTGQRAEYRRLGFAESELLTEFGYPTQRLVLPPVRGEAEV